MTRTAFLTSLLAFAGSTAVSAGTFVPAPVLEDPGVEVLSRRVAREAVDRDLLSKPYATAVIGSVDIYDKFPYLESRTFEIVSDAGWNRLVYGEVGGELHAFDGRNTSFGALSEPKGLATDAAGRVYVADSGNHRVAVFTTRREFDRMELVPAFTIEGLSRPSDVAHSDAGTPFDASDDKLYVADTGANRVCAFDLEPSGARLRATVGELGSGINRFAGPTAVAVGRAQGVNTSDVYVADAHSGRLVRLVDEGGSLLWATAASLEGGLATSLDVDANGNVYAALPQSGRIEKRTQALQTLASTEGGVTRPRDFTIPFVTQTDHRTGAKSWMNPGSGLVVEEWDENSGIRLLKLGVDVKNLSVTGEGDVRANFLLTDHAHVTADLVDEATGRIVARRELDAAAGDQSMVFAGSDPEVPLNDGAYVLRVRAKSSSNGLSSEDESSFPLQGSGNVAPARASLLASHPNPFSQSTRIGFAVPAGAPRAVRVGVYDVSGRLVKSLESGTLSAGIHSRTWDGRDESGRLVSAGVYMTRYEVGGETLTQKVVRMR